jgi:hypothetical protein
MLSSTGAGTAMPSIARTTIAATTAVARIAASSLFSGAVRAASSSFGPGDATPRP